MIYSFYFIRLKQRVFELEDFKQNANIEEKTESFLKQKDMFEKQVKIIK